METKKYTYKIYKKIQPKNNRNIKILKTNQRKKLTKMWILNATSMLKPWHPEFNQKSSALNLLVSIK